MDIWHGSVTEYNGTYYMSYIDASDKHEVYLCTSDDGINFGEPQIVVKNEGYWNNLYRPFLWYDGTNYTCIYGVVNSSNQWYLSMSYGESPDSLRGITEADSDKMVQLNDHIDNPHSYFFQLKNLFKIIRGYFRIELLFIAAVEIVLMIIFKKMRKSKIYIAICSILNILLSVWYLIIRTHITNVFHIIGALIAILAINVIMTIILAFIQTLYNNTSTNKKTDENIS